MNRSEAAALPAPWRAELPVLLRWRLLAGNVAAALAGALLVPRQSAPALLLAVALGCGLLVAAATILNQWQERDLDARMRRTWKRPLVTGRIAPAPALLAALGCAAAGLLLLFACAPAAAAVGLAALFCYNGLYTPLKRRSVLALLPGAISGALPPLLGWCAAGGTAGDPRGLLPAGLMLLWQLPHIGLLAREQVDDCRAAGLPNLAEHLAPERLQGLIRLWCAALCAAALLLPALGLLQGTVAWGYLTAVALLLPLPVWDKTLARRLQLFPPLLASALLLQQLLP